MPRKVTPKPKPRGRRRKAASATPEAGPRPGAVGARAFAFSAAVITLVMAVATLARDRVALPPRAGQSIVVGGVLHPIGTPVVLWRDPGGYSAYDRHCHDRPDRILPAKPAPGADTPDRIGPRAGLPGGPEALAEAITQLVIHYDQAWTSRKCFHVLQDVRGLSVHFMLDLDGTLYQTCDVAEKARHARTANDRSVGVEIAHPGVLEEVQGLSAHYRRDEGGLRLDLPASLGPSPLRTPGFVPRPARPEPVRATIQGHLQTQYDFTEAQYRALARLAAGLSRALPRIALDVPRDRDGRVLDHTIPDAATAAAFQGIVGHYHLQTDKSDPGPAFDWERFLAEARRVRDGGE